MAATQLIKTWRRGQELQYLLFILSIRTGKKGDRSDVDCGMLVGVRRGGLSISETADFLGMFHAQQSLEFYRELSEKQKTSREHGSSAGINGHVANERGQRRVAQTG